MHARTPSRSLAAGLRPVALSAALAAALALCASVPARADAPKHPHYLQALADLKHAHTLLDPVTAPGVHPTQAAIDRAIAEIERAAFTDRESLEKTPRIDTSMANETRYQEVQKLLRSAERDLGYEEDDKAALGWRGKAQAAVQDAERSLDRMLASDVKGQHPHYMQALSDLRGARGLLEGSRDRDAAKATDDIDRAIGEIKQAAIDDGKELGDHPPVDATQGARSRYQQALKLLADARRDLAYEEDDKAALGWRKRAMAAVDDARRLVERSEKQAHS
jgi:hypothetical protein